MNKVNPITLETTKNRLIAIGREMAATMVRTAGSPIYAEIKDFSCGLFDYQARQVVYAGLAIFHNLAIQNLVQTSIQLHGEEPGIFDGDIFMGSDPYLGGGVHSAELGLASPIFVDGEIVAWSGSIAHQLDVGGMNPGGFFMYATECFQEGIRFPPVKLYSKGELQRDISAIHRNNVRLPDKIIMELRGQIAANNVAKERVKELVAKFGVEAFREICDALIQLSARLTEEKIRQLPEGVYEYADFEEVEGIGDGLFTINCDLTVKDGKLIFDFTRDCPPQVPKFINSTKVTTKGLIFGNIMPVLCYDVPWSEGCTYPIEILTTPGTIIDAQPPVACSDPMVSLRAADAATGALNKALSNSPLRDRISACWQGVFPINVGMAPGPPSGPPIIMPLVDSMSGGGGAFSMKDGLNTSSALSIMEYSMGDVETQENAYPILYLTRRLLRDSGGPGRYRGGAGSLIAVIPHKTAGCSFILSEDRRLVPAHGTMGGYPGVSNHWLVGRQIDVFKAIREGLGDTKEILLKLKLMPAIILLDVGPEDVYVYITGGGGGFGDPLNRDPEKVARDVLWGLVSHEQARQIYVVVFKSGTLEVDEAQTKLERDRIRASRAPNGGRAKSDAAWSGGDYIVLAESDRGLSQLCSRCHRVLSSIDENWKERVISKDSRMDEIGMLIPGDNRVVLRQYICPDCGHLLDSEVTLRSMKPLRDFTSLK